jgi:sugar lactone lactonase YvrE
VVVANAGGVLSGLSNPIFATGVVQGMHEGPDGNLYVGLDTSGGQGTGGEILKFSPTGILLGVIHLPNDPNQGNFFFYPFGFSLAADGTFWVAQPNTGNVVHLDASGTLIKSYSVGSGSNPEWTAVRSDGQVFVSNETGGIIQQLDPASGTVTTFATDPNGLPLGLSFTAAGNLLVADPNVGVEVFNGSGSLIQTVFDFGALDTQLDQNGNFMIGNADFASVDKFDPNGNFLTFTNIPGVPIGLAVAGVDGPAPPAATLDNFYSFHLNPGESATIALKQLAGTGTETLTLQDGMGTVLAMGTTGATNFTLGIANFVSQAGGTYYLDVHGNNINYSLTVAKNAAFDKEPNDTQVTAQPLPGAGGAVGAVFAPPGVTLGTTFEGMSFNDTNCGCIPPDTNDAVGPTQVVEAINLTLRVSDKAGNNLLTEQLSQLFPSVTAFSDPYVVYDDIANHFVLVYLTANSSGGDGLAFVVSKDSNVLDGWLPLQNIDFGSNLLDFPKVGFNADAYVVTGNLFGAPGTPLQFITVDKDQLLNHNNFVDYQYQRDGSHFRAEVPAQMHGATTGMPMYLVEEAGYGNGTAARVVTLTNELSNSPSFMDTDIPVDPYSFPPPADQPGGSGSVATNDTTFSHAEWRMINGQGMLVSAQNVSVPDDGFTTSRVRWYEFDTNGTPSLVQQGTINPGPGVSTYYGAPALDINGDIGITYMESSANEFVSMYVAGRLATDPLGTLSAGTDVAPGVATNFEFFRTGDYGGMSVDPTDGLTFWAAHEYGGTNPVYNTFIASFTIQAHHDEDFYSFNTNMGDHLVITLNVPGSSTGAQFVNNLSPLIDLFDSNGNLVASGTTSITFTSQTTGTYAVRVSGANNTQGEYSVQVSGATGPAPMAVQPVAPITATSGLSAQPGGAQAAVLGNSVAQESLAFTSLMSGASRGATTSNNSTAMAFSTNGTAGNAGQVSYGTSATDAAFAAFAQGSQQVTTEDLFTSLARQLVPVSAGASMLTTNDLEKEDVLSA